MYTLFYKLLLYYTINYRDIITYWTNFAKNGSPNPSNSWASWPEYKEPEWKYLNLTVGMPGLTGMKTMADDCKFFNQVVPKFVRPVRDKTDKYPYNFDGYTCPKFSEIVEAKFL